jgi:hypothetical protein
MLISGRWRKRGELGGDYFKEFATSIVGTDEARNSCKITLA